MRQPLVSFCIPTFNGANFIGECLDSIARQTLGDYEVVVVDDSSTDATVEIVRERAKADPRIIIHPYAKNSGGGGAGNYNRCLNHARGMWIKFLFQDDLLTPDCLEKLVAASGGGARFVMSLLEYFSDSDDCCELLANHEMLPTLASVFDGGTCIKPEAFCRELLCMWPVNFVGAPSASLVHADCFRKYGQFRSDFMTMADFEFWIRVASQEGVALVPERLARFRLHRASTTSIVTRGHGYRNTLERVLTRFLMLGESSYAAFRDPEMSGVSEDDLYAGFVKEARGAHWLAVDALKGAGDASLMEQWDSYCAVNPNLYRSFKKLGGDQGMIARIRNKIDRFGA